MGQALERNDEAVLSFEEYLRATLLEIHAARSQVKDLDGQVKHLDGQLAESERTLAMRLIGLRLSENAGLAARVVEVEAQIASGDLSDVIEYDDFVKLYSTP